MIPQEHKPRIIQDGIHFLTAISQAYGAEEGMRLWERIAEVLDPSVKGDIFFAMLTGQYNDRIYAKLDQSRPAAAAVNKISVIKCIRTYTGLGLSPSPSPTTGSPLEKDNQPTSDITNLKTLQQKRAALNTFVANIKVTENGTKVENPVDYAEAKKIVDELANAYKTFKDSLSDDIKT